MENSGKEYHYSLEVSHTTRGNTWTVKVRDDDDEKAVNKLNGLYKKLKAEYDKET